MRPRYVPRFEAATPELGCRVKAPRCIWYTTVLENGVRGGWSPSQSVRSRVCNDDAFQGGGAVVARLARRRATPTRGTRDAPSIGIQQHLLAVDATPSRGFARAVDAIAVKLTCRDLGHKCVPVVVRALNSRVEIDDPSGLPSVHSVEEHQVHTGGALREHGKVGATLANRRAQRKARAVRARRGSQRDVPRRGRGVHARALYHRSCRAKRKATSSSEEQE